MQSGNEGWAVRSNASEGQLRLAVFKFSTATSPITRSTITNNMVIFTLPTIRRICSGKRSAYQFDDV